MASYRLRSSQQQKSSHIIHHFNRNKHHLVPRLILYDIGSSTIFIATYRLQQGSHNIVLIYHLSSILNTADQFLHTQQFTTVFFFFVISKNHTQDSTYKTLSLLDHYLERCCHTGINLSLNRYNIVVVLESYIQLSSIHLVKQCTLFDLNQFV